MKKCLIISLSLLSLTLLLSLLCFYPTTAPSSPARAPHVLQRRPPRVTHLTLTTSLPSLSSLFSSDHSLNDPSRVVWPHMRDLLSRPDTLPPVSESIQEASIAFESLLKSISQQKDANFDEYSEKLKSKCPLTVRGIESEIEIPCGFVEDSAITIIGVPIVTNGSFKFAIEVFGSNLGDKMEDVKRPIILHWNVNLNSNGSIIYQNNWSPRNGWGELESCPGTNNTDKVDGLVKCNSQVSDIGALRTAGVPFFESHPFVATLWTGTEGFHMNINGRHETSYQYKQEPWSVTKIRIKGDINLLSILANNLPVPESPSNTLSNLNLNQLKPPKNKNKKEVVLLIGVFSSANNFKRRIAIRRSWMQFADVISGDVVVKFFTGLVCSKILPNFIYTPEKTYNFTYTPTKGERSPIPLQNLEYIMNIVEHKNEKVNLELWREAELYEDIQILPFVDYYTLITLKTIAICIFGTRILPAKYIMKVDDDAFIRIDEILFNLNKTNPNGLLYGLISFQSSPHRDRYSKWFISEEEWANESYPPWAHGPGYIISNDIAKFIVQGHEERYLQLFKLEDVAMGIWIDEYKKTGQEVNYINDENFHVDGCESEYILAHYQSPRLLLCLWAKLQNEQRPFCCE